jgi:hypothetical protein
MWKKKKKVIYQNRGKPKISREGRKRCGKGTLCIKTSCNARSERYNPIMRVIISVTGSGLFIDCLDAGGQCVHITTTLFRLQSGLSRARWRQTQSRPRRMMVRWLRSLIQLLRDAKVDGCTSKLKLGCGTLATECLRTSTGSQHGAGATAGGAGTRGSRCSAGRCERSRARWGSHERADLTNEKQLTSDCPTRNKHHKPKC